MKKQAKKGLKKYVDESTLKKGYKCLGKAGHEDQREYSQKEMPEEKFAKTKTKED